MKKIITAVLLLSSSIVIANTPTITNNNNNNYQGQYKNIFDSMFGDNFFEKINNLNQRMAKEMQRDDFFSSKSWLRFNDKSKLYEIRIDVGNLAKSEIDITTQNTMLVVQGTSSSKTKNTQQTSNFYRSFSLPKDADVNSIEAKQTDGLLLITIKQAKPKVKKIKIN